MVILRLWILIVNEWETNMPSHHYVTRLTQFVRVIGNRGGDSNY